MKLLSGIKNTIVPSGQHARTVRFGPLRGVRLNLDLTRQSQVWIGLAEREIYAWLAKLSSGIRTALDIGAADGQYTSYFLLRTSARRVWSFDPKPEALGLITNNLALNGFREFERWTFAAQCVGSQDHSNACALGSLYDAIDYPCLIKVDVDGAELDVLHSGNELLRRADVRWIVETHSRDLELACLDLFAESGHKTQVIDNAWWRLFVPETRPIPHNRWLVAYHEPAASKRSAR